MAIHGGLEEGTETMAEAVAEATGASLYAVVQPQTLWWHVPSIRYDPAESAALAAEQQELALPDDHDNIRGPSYYH